MVLKKKISEEIIKSIPSRALTNIELLSYVKALKISNFRGVFMINTLPNKILKNERGIVNLDSVYGTGTHWVCYNKRENIIDYFDFGNLRLFVELVRYFKSSRQEPIKMHYNYNHYQCIDTVNWGHLCLSFLNRNNVLSERK